MYKVLGTYCTLYLFTYIMFMNIYALHTVQAAVIDHTVRFSFMLVQCTVPYFLLLNLLSLLSPCDMFSLIGANLGRLRSLFGEYITAQYVLWDGGGQSPGFEVKDSTSLCRTRLTRTKNAFKSYFWCENLNNMTKLSKTYILKEIWVYNHNCVSIWVSTFLVEGSLHILKLDTFFQCVVVI